MSDRNKRYFVRTVYGDAFPFHVIFRDTDTLADANSRFLDPDAAQRKANFMIRRKQNAPKVPVARLITTKKWYSVGKETVTRMQLTADGRITYSCTCSGSAGQLGCKHIDAVETIEENA